MKQIELYIDRGYGEKSLILSSQPISFSEKYLIDADFVKDVPGLIVFNSSGFSPPPFIKGSRVLRSIREKSRKKFHNWKKIISINDSDLNFFNFLDYDQFEEDKNSKYWGVWVSEEKFKKTTLIALNFPIWTFRIQWEKANNDQKFLEDNYSMLYRIVLSSIDAYLNFKTSEYSSILFADIGGGQKLSQELNTIRIKILAESIAAWLTNTNKLDQVIISCGANNGVNPTDIMSAWSKQIGDLKGTEEEYGEALELRAANAKLCNGIARLDIVIHKYEYIIYILKETSKNFALKEHLFLEVDLIQARKILETILEVILKLNNLKHKKANLFKYIERLEKSSKIAAWMTSYCHTIRMLGNQGAHFNDGSKKNPERLETRDLIVLHATLNRVLAFFQKELEIKG